MLDMEPRLETRLRSFYEHIEREDVPAALSSVYVAPNPRRRRTLNRVAGGLGIVAMAVVVALFALELTGHHSQPSPASGTAALAHIPQYGSGGLPVTAHKILLPVTRGRGSASLTTFSADERFYIQFACSDGGSVTFLSAGGAVRVTVPHCTGRSTTVGEPSDTATPSEVLATLGPPMTFAVITQPSTTWEIIAVENGTDTLPALGGAPVPPSARVILPLTEGTGSATLPAFTPTEPFYIQWACLGNGRLEIQSTVFTHWIPVECASGGAVGTFAPSADQLLGVPVTLHIDAPSTTWEILVEESDAPTPPPIPSGFQLPQGARVLIPITHGAGSVSLPAFTPTEYWYVVSSCSGDAPLQIVSSSGATVGATSCGGGVIDGSGHALQAPGQRVQLSIRAAASSTWEILIYERNGPQP